MAGIELGTRTGRLVLTAAVLGSGMALLDGTVVNVALVRIGEDLDASLEELQWITNGYLLALASLILLGGSLGDRFGRRRVFVIGVIWFALASLACGLAQSPGQLIAARLLQGVGQMTETMATRIIMRALPWPDAFPSSDHRLLRAAGASTTVYAQPASGYYFETNVATWVFKRKAS